jgi:YVTN family beta-propeller protein
VSRIAEGSGTLVSTIGCCTKPFALGYGADSSGRDWLFMADVGAGEVVRINPDTEDYTKVGVGRRGRPRAIAVRHGKVWVADSADSTVYQLDAASGRILGATGVERDPRGVAVFRGVWVSNAGSDSVSALNADTGRVARLHIPVGRSPRAIAAGAGRIWVANYLDDTVSRIDPNTLSTEGDPIPVGRRPLGLTVHAGSLWVANSGDDTVMRIDVRTGRPVGSPIRVGAVPQRLVVAGGALWVVNTGDDTVTRIELSQIR